MTDERERRMLAELKEMKKHKLPLSILSKKRVRVPQADQDNPFCSDRQLADATQLQRINKNPQLYQHTSTTQIYQYHLQINQVQKLVFSSVLSTEVKKPVITFGHRPQSASRHFNPTSLRLNASAENSKAPKETHVNIGMSADSLRSLLSKPERKSQSKSHIEPNTNEKTKQLEALERGFNVRPEYTPPGRASSILNVAPDASVGELIQKYRKLAVGLD
ncbi:hypothetical protein THRCLA_21277 [Thraustotheca clavata]|uniref:Uncharacterized protein n=1 Tax=Thraustotheca clavata TaxID=74557 RepID=A0A1V9ZYW8_9STRA|nr:hypothetical protein THRCLA_21277 [Thraustotheca clavata]